MIIKSKDERYQKTLNFLKRSINKNCKMLDLGTPNSLSKFIVDNGYNVTNTSGEDLDVDYDIVKQEDFDVVTAFEIFEHMLCPFNLLKSINAKTLITSVPLKLWFANAYWNSNDDRDKHYHEFEVKQFNFLLEKTGWKIVKYEKWKAVIFKIGIRPILRFFTDRYYIVHCVREN